MYGSGYKYEYNVGEGWVSCDRCGCWEEGGGTPYIYILLDNAPG